MSTDRPTTKIANIAVYVADLERSERFYTDVLGLVVQARVNTPTVDEVILAGAEGGSSLMIARSKESPETPVPSGIWKTFIETSDVEALYRAALAAGAPSVMAPVHLDQFNVTIAMVHDPDGYLVELGWIGPRP